MDAITSLMRTNFETQTCSRCHGSGSYSYCQQYGHKCFKCAGSGKTLTKRGAAARAYYETLCTVPANAVVIGDRIAASGMTLGGIPFSYVGTVTEIKSRQATKTTVRTARPNSTSIDVSYKVEYEQTDGFSLLESSGSTVEFPGMKGYTGEAGTKVEKFTEYLFTTVSSKYGIASKTTSDSVRVYPKDSEVKLAEALEYQNKLTKSGTIRKSDKSLDLNNLEAKGKI